MPPGAAAACSPDGRKIVLHSMAVTRQSDIKGVFRLTGWFLLFAIGALSLVSPELRPITFFPHALEHFAIFFSTGVAFAVGYPKREWLLLFALTAYAASIEYAQTSVPGRHARLSDLAIDVTAACLGVMVVFIGVKLKRSHFD